MKTPFKYLTFIGTALIVATGSSAAFAQSNTYNKFYDSGCDYTPQNRYCIGTNYRNRMMNSSNMMMNNADGMTQPNTNTSSQTNQPLNSNVDSRARGTFQESQPSQSSVPSNSMNNQNMGDTSPGMMNNGTSMEDSRARGTFQESKPTQNSAPTNSMGNQNMRITSPGSMNNGTSMPQR